MTAYMDCKSMMEGKPYRLATAAIKLDRVYRRYGCSVGMLTDSLILYVDHGKLLEIIPKHIDGFPVEIKYIGKVKPT